MGIVLAVFAAIAVSTVGCSFRYTMDVEGVARNAADGAPLSGVNVHLKGPFEDDGRSVTSGPDGAFYLRFHVWNPSVSPASPWRLVLSANGFLDEEVDLTPLSAAALCAGENKINPIIVRVYLRPMPPTDTATGSSTLRARAATDRAACSPDPRRPAA
ncbi:MAG: hypothetical protein U0836_11590 [Pirellulales bacterium]